MRLNRLQRFIVGVLGAFAVFFVAPHSIYAASKYWVGGTDNWNGTAGNKWATTSGGSTTTTLPTSADNCFFDANSTGTVTVASGNTGCGSIDFTGFTRTFAMSAALTISGNVTLVSAMTISGSSTLTVNTSSTLTSNGKTWPSSLALSNINGTYTLADDWTVTGNVTIGTDFGGVSTITFNGSTIYVGGNLTIGTQHPTVTGTTNIVLNGTGTLSGSGIAGALKNNLTINTTGTITIGDLYYNTGTFTYTTGTVIVTTSTTFTAGGALVLPSGIPWYNLTLSGSGASYTIPASTTIRGSLSLSGASATYTLLGDVTVPGNLTLGANNTGVAITTLNGFTLYVGGSMTLGNNQPITTGSTNIVLTGTGTWSGSTTGALRNNLTINTTGTISIVGTVGYNTGTLTYTTGTVAVGTSTLSIASGTTMNTAGITWNNITFSGTAPVALSSNLTVNGSTTISGSTTLSGPGLLVFTASSTLAGSSALSTYNSFTFASGMANVYTGTLSFISTSTTATSTLTSNGVPFAGSLTINSSNTIQLADALNVTSTKTLTLTAGRFDANNQNVTIGAFSSSGSTARTLTVGSGVWTLTGTGTIWTTATNTNLTYSTQPTLSIINTSTTAKTFTGATTDFFAGINIASSTAGTVTLSGASNFGNVNVSSTAPSSIFTWNTSGATFNNLDFTGSTSTWNGTTAGNIKGNLTLGSGMTASSTAVITFNSTSTTATSTITSNGVTILNGITINSSNTVQLADALTASSTATLTLTAGRFDANNMAVTLGAFSSSNSNTRTLTMGSNIWTLNGNLDPWTATTATGFTLVPGSSTIKLTGAYTAAKTFAGGGLTYNNFWSALPTNAFAIQFTGSNTFNDFKLNASTTVKFTANTTTTVATFTAIGTAGNLITIDSITTSTHALVKAGGGVILGDYLSIQHSIATPTRTWFAGLNSTNNQSTATAGSGWYFTLIPPNDATSVSAGITNRNVIVSWVAPTTYIGGSALSDLATFSVYRDTDPLGSFTTLVGSSIASSTLSFTDQNPAIGTTVYYAVTSINASGTESFKSSPTGAILLSVASVSSGGGGTPAPSTGNTITPIVNTTIIPSSSSTKSTGSVTTSSGSGAVSASPIITPSTSSFSFGKNLKQGNTHADIFTLQKYLNTQGFTIAKTGPGSPGNETNFFGLYTKQALIKFQEAHRAEILTPAGLTKGTGYFGPLTRAWVNAH